MIKYPAAIDTTVELPYVVDNVTPISGDLINNLRDAIVAMEAELGVKPSGIYSNVRSRLNAIELNITNILGGGGAIYGGDLEAVTPIVQKVVGLQARAISDISPEDGYILTWSQLNNSWEPQPAVVSGTPGGLDTHIQFNDNGALGGAIGLTYNKTTNVVAISDAVAIGGGITSAAGLIRVKNGTATGIITKRDVAGTADKTALAIGTGDDLYVGSNSAGTQTFDYVNMYSTAGTALAVANDIKLQISANSNDFIKLGGSSATTGMVRLPDGAIVSGRNSINTTNHNILTWNSGVLFIGNTDASSTSIIGNIGVGVRGDSITFSNTNNNQDFSRFTVDGFQVGSAIMDLGGGTGVIGIDNATTNPTTNPTNGIVAYVDASDGYLKYRKADGSTVILDGTSPADHLVVNIMDYYQDGDGYNSYTLGGVAVNTKNIALALQRAYDAKIKTYQAFTLFIPPASDYGVKAYSWKEQLTWQVNGINDNVTFIEILGSGDASIIIPDTTAGVDTKLYVAGAGPGCMSMTFSYRRMFWVGDENVTNDCASVLKTSVDMEVLMDECTFYNVQSNSATQGVVHLDAMGLIVRRTYFHACTNSAADGAVVVVGSGCFGALFDHCNWYAWEKTVNPFGGTHYDKGSIQARYHVLLAGGGNTLTASRIKFLHCTWAENGMWGSVLAKPGSLIIDSVHFEQCNVYANNRRLFEARGNVRHTIVEYTTIQHNSAGDASIHLQDVSCEYLTLRGVEGTHAGILVTANTGQKSIIIEQCEGGTYNLSNAIMVNIDEVSTFDSITLPAVPNRANVAHEDGIQIGSTVDFGGGVKVIGIDNADVNPTTNPTNGIVAYVDAGDGYLKYRKADGSIVNLNGESSGSFTAGGDLSGNSTSQTVTGIQTTPVSSATPNNDDILVYSSANDNWEPTAITSVGAWDTVYEVDFSSLPTQSFLSNGNVTIDGKIWTVENFASATSIGIVNGTGLQLSCNTTSTDYINSTRNSLLVKTKLKQLFPAFDASQHKIRISLYFTHNADQDFENTVLGIEDENSPMSLSYATLKGTSGNGWQHRITQASVSTTNVDATNMSHNVVQFTFFSPTEVEVRSGVYSSGFPDQESTYSRRKWTLASAQIPYANSDDVAFFFSALTFNNNGNFISTAIRMKVEVFQTAVVIGDTGWTTAYELDFSQQPSQTFSSNTTYTIDGRTWTKVNTANEAAAAAIVNGSGLVLQPASASDYYSNVRTAPGISLPLSSIIPNFELGIPIRVWLYISAGNFTANFDNALAVVDSGNLGLAYRTSYGEASSDAINNLIVYNTGSISTAGTKTINYTTDKVLMLDIPNIGMPNYRSAFGSYNSGFPSANTLTSTPWVNVTGAADTSGMTAANAQIFLGAMRAGSGTAFSVTIARIKVEYLPKTVIGGMITSGYGTYAARPTQVAAGSHYTPSDGYNEFVSTGSEWRPIINGKVGKEPPSQTAFTLVTANGLTNASTLVKENGVLRFSWNGNGSVGSGEPVRLAYKTAPANGSTGYRVTVHAKFIPPSQNGGSFNLLAGLGWRNSSTGNIELMEWNFTSAGLTRPQRRRYTASGTGSTPTFTFSAQTIGTNDTAYYDIWLRIQRTATGNRDFYISTNGSHWHQLTATGFPSTSNEFFTPDQILILSCIFGESGANAGSLCGTIFDSYEEESY